ncbi:MAG TPA: ABC transporter ATP-binding protein [Limnobacter sp.]|nr:ABC transporter ATP-binding protein [Limnobacter sp.]
MNLTPSGTPSDQPVLRVEGLSKQLGGVRLFEDVALALQAGESLAVVGESGSGKSTLLHLMAGLETPDTGTVQWHGQALATLAPAALAKRRLRHVGLVFQAYYLMPHLNAIQNVELPFLLAGEQPDHARTGALLAQVGMAHKAKAFPRELSGGEQQRVAIARALALKPPLILADEPTGNLDEDNADKVLHVLLQSCANEGSGLVMVTHSHHAASALGHQLRLAKHHLTEGQ